jgi:membrane protein implicated in regulation of membrane protease activity
LHPLDILFVACLMLGGAYTLVSLLMGGFSHVAGHVGHIGDALHLSHLSDMVGHHDASAVDAGHAGPAAHGDALAHAHHADAHHADAHHHAEGEEGGDRFSLFAYLNPMSVAGFLLGFGGAGTVSRLLGVHPLASLLYAFASGWGMWLLAYLIITRVFGAAGGTSHNRQEDLIGLRGHVTAPIEGTHAGMVCYVISGTRQQVRAVTDDGETIPVGAQVRIRRIEANTAYVYRIDEDAAPLYNRLS